MNYTLTKVVTGFCFLLCFALNAHAQDSKEHDILKKDVGTWTAECKMWAAGPDADPIVSPGKEVNRMLPGGKWMVSDFEGEFGGETFNGHGVFGYDPDKKKYVGTWIDSMSPYMMKMEGTYNDETKTMTMFYTAKDESGQEAKGKTVSVTKDEKTRVFTMYMQTAESKDDFVKMMEITYHKK